MSSRWYQVILVGVLALAFIGFFVGTRSDNYEGVSSRGFPEPNAQSAPAGAEAEQAPTYGQLLERPHSSNEQWRGALARRSKSPSDGSEAEGSAEERPRMANRAYGGAPPTVPHPIQQREALACAACHQEGLRIEGRDAPAMSHAFMTNCTQCHAAEDPQLPFATDAPETISTVNSFEGQPEWTDGPRAWFGAPPRIPHRVDMREECGSCHGPHGQPGPMSHEFRTQCRQCHVPSGDAPPGSPGHPLPFQVTGSQP